MDYYKMHQGNLRQKLTPLESKNPEEAMISEQLHVPEIPDVTAESKVLHSDIEGSPYSSTPGKMTLAEAAEQADARGTKQAKDKDEEAARVRSQPARASSKD